MIDIFLQYFCAKLKKKSHKELCSYHLEEFPVRTPRNSCKINRGPIYNKLTQAK